MRGRRLRLILAATLLAGACVVSAQSLYKYRGENGEWIYSDRPPDDSSAVDEVRNLATGTSRGRVAVLYGNRCAPSTQVIGIPRSPGGVPSPACRVYRVGSRVKQGLA